MGCYIWEVYLFEVLVSLNGECGSIQVLLDVHVLLAAKG